MALIVSGIKYVLDPQPRWDGLVLVATLFAFAAGAFMLVLAANQPSEAD